MVLVCRVVTKKNEMKWNKKPKYKKNIKSIYLSLYRKRSSSYLKPFLFDEEEEEEYINTLLFFRNNATKKPSKKKEIIIIIKSKFVISAQQLFFIYICVCVCSHCAFYFTKFEVY